MNLIQKTLLFFKKEGLRSTLNRTAEKIREITVRIPGILQEKLKIDYFYHLIRQKASGKNVYIVVPCIDWNIPLFQRPHQIATVLSKQPGSHVFFVSDEYRYDNFAGIETVNPHMDLLSWRIVEKIGSAFYDALQVTIFMSWPRHADLLKYIHYNKLVYEYIDDLSLFYYYTDDMKNKHYELIREADLTLCTARALYEDAKPIAKKVLFSPNAGDYDFFCRNRNCPTYPGLEEKVRSYNCVIGYYGCLAEWFDYDLVISVAKRRTDWCFVLVGYCFDGTIARLQEEPLDNIILYPAQPYAELPRFVSAFDIQTIPFVINDITKATSPVKLFEYMAVGKPILTSAMPECLRYKSVTIYRDLDDFIEKAEHLLHIRNNPDYIAQMDMEAKNNTWESRVDQILAELNGGISSEN